MQTIIEKDPRSTNGIESPHVEIDLDLSPFLKIDMVDTIQPITTSAPTVDSTVKRIEYISCDGPYTRKRDNQPIFFCRQEKNVAFNLETGEIIDDTQSWMIPYTPERMQQVQDMISRIGYVFRNVSTK